MGRGWYDGFDPYRPAPPYPPPPAQNQTRHILRQARQVLGLGNGNDPLLHIPAQQNLCRGLTVLACQILWQKRSFLPPFLPSWRKSSGSIALVQQILHQHTRHTIVHRNGDPVGFIHMVRRINTLHTAQRSNHQRVAFYIQDPYRCCTRAS